jgi:hypothetical protein
MKKHELPHYLYKVTLCLLLLACFSMSYLYAQIKPPVEKEDTISIEQKNTKLFYNNLQQRAWKSKFLTELHRLVFISYDTSHHVKIPQESHIRFLKFKGKRIRSINFIGLDVFGQSVNDSTQKYSNWFENAANKIHIYTRNSVLRKLLLQKEGDVINPFLLAENEHIIRDLPYISDVKFILLPDSQDNDFVDIVILTQDVYSVGFIFQPLNISSTKFGVYNINLWGLGHRQSNMFMIDPMKKEQLRYVEGHYRIENIDGLFMSGELHYTNYTDKKSIGVDLTRKFITSDTRVAGGLSYSHNNETLRDNDFILMNSKYDLLNTWVGYAFPFHSKKKDTTYNNRFVTTISMDKIQYGFRNIVTQTDYLRAKNQTILISGLSYTSNAYYRDNLLFGYGSSEDIPYGKLFGIQGGYSFEELYNRYYVDAYYSAGNRINNFGYINYSIESGGYIHSGVFEDGILKSKLSLASQLYTHGAHHFRHYINLTYVRGINLSGSERIIINDKYGIRGLKSEILTGTQKLSMNFESVMFSPVYILGFRFSTFGFLDVGFIGSESKPILNQQMYSGLGIGIRIKNENLVFNTFQLRFAFYPLEPERSNRFSVDVSDVPSASFSDFTVKQPQVISFE